VLPGGPVPVALPALDAAQRRTLSHAGGYLTIDAHGVVRWGLDMTGAKPFVGQVLERDDSAFGQLFPYPDERGHEHHAFRSDYVVEPDADVFVELTHDAATEVLILADAEAPARITMRRALAAFGRHASTLATGAANTAVLYRSGAEPWTSPDTDPHLVLHVDKLGALAEQHPERVVLELDDDTTTGALVTALGVLGAAGVERVRLHRMMGWGGVPPSEVVQLGDAPADDDWFSSDGPDISVSSATVEGGLEAAGVDSALRAWNARFRYCIETRRRPTLHGDIKISFDVAADGTISHVKATGLDPKIDSCIAGALFDLDITPLSIHGAGHATAAIAATPHDVPTPQGELPKPTPSGYWCWTDGDVGLCAHLQEECEVALDAYSRTGASLGEPVHATPCKAQRTAWTSDGEHWQPTKKLCGRGCKQAR
jgi:hypothetical protein